MGGDEVGRWERSQERTGDGRAGGGRFAVAGVGGLGWLLGSAQPTQLNGGSALCGSHTNGSSASANGRCLCLCLCSSPTPPPLLPLPLDVLCTLCSFVGRIAAAALVPLHPILLPSSSSPAPPRGPS